MVHADWCGSRAASYPCHFRVWERCSRCFSFVWRCCCFKGIFFQCSVFFVCPPLSTLFLFTEFVYGIHLIFFESSCVESLSLRSFVPRVRGSAPCVRARRLSFNPRGVRKAERACRVVSRAYRAKRVAAVESWRFLFKVSFSTFILVPSRVLCFLNEVGCNKKFQKKYEVTSDA